MQLLPILEVIPKIATSIPTIQTLLPPARDLVPRPASSNRHVPFTDVIL